MNYMLYGIRDCRVLSEDGMCIIARIAGQYWGCHIVRDSGWDESSWFLLKIVLDYCMYSNLWLLIGDVLPAENSIQDFYGKKNYGKRYLSS
jgi:hypothetical protein